MDYGLCLPNFREGSSREGMEAAAETAERLGWSTVWTTDHILVANEDADDYGRIYDAILSLAWIGAKFTKVRLGTSVSRVPRARPSTRTAFRSSRPPPRRLDDPCRG